MRRLLLAFALLTVPIVPVMAQDTAIAVADTAIALPDTVVLVAGEVVPTDTVTAPPEKLPGSAADFINQYFSQIILLLSAAIMWLLVRFAPGFDVAKDAVKYGVYGVSVLATYVIARYLGGTVPEGLSDLLGTVIDGLLPMLITALGGVSLYNMSMSQRKMVTNARDPLGGAK